MRPDMLDPNASGGDEAIAAALESQVKERLAAELGLAPQEAHGSQTVDLHLELVILPKLQLPPEHHIHGNRNATPLPSPHAPDEQPIPRGPEETRVDPP